MHKDCCELTDQVYTSVPCCISVAIKESVAAFLAAAWVTSPACEWEHEQVEACAGIQYSTSYYCVCNICLSEGYTLDSPNTFPYFIIRNAVIP